MGIFWKLAFGCFTLALLPLEPLFAFKQIIVLVMSALVAIAVLDESRNVVSPD